MGFLSNILNSMFDYSKFIKQMEASKPSNFGAYVQFCQSKRKSTHFHKRIRVASR